MENDFNYIFRDNGKEELIDIIGETETLFCQNKSCSHPLAKFNEKSMLSYSKITVIEPSDKSFQIICRCIKCKKFTSFNNDTKDKKLL